MSRAFVQSAAGRAKDFIRILLSVAVVKLVVIHIYIYMELRVLV